MDIGTLVIAVLALLVSGWSAWTAHRALKESRRVGDIEAERRAEEVAARDRAEMVVEFERRSKGGGPLLIRNHGPAAAADVDLVIDAETHHLILRRDGLPVAHLAAGDEHPLPAMTTGSTSASIPYTLRWSDPAGDHQEERRLSLR
jgi:hypothetical protein